MTAALQYTLLALSVLVSYLLSKPPRPIDAPHAALLLAAYVLGASLGFFATGGSFTFTVLSGMALAVLIGRWNRKLVLGGLSLDAAESLAFKTAWRRGGQLRLEDLVRAGLDEDTAKAVMQNLLQRGLCRLQDGVYRFERD